LIWLRNLEINGSKIYDALLPVIEQSKQVLNKTPGLSVLTRDDINGQGFYDYDETKIVIKVNELGLTGFEVYDILKEEYGIQVELAESYVVLAIAGIGDDAGTIARLVEALQDIAGKHFGKKPCFELEQMDAFEKPMAVVSPRDAFYSPKRLININESVGEICAESIMIYQPGIPLAVPGEKITQGIIDHFNFYRQQHCVIMHNSDDPDMIQVLGEIAV
jgi:arginine/lysine/ornithine decarboxylase